MIFPTKPEIKLLIFGIMSNIVVYFYVFQNSLKIDYFITIYFTIILVLFLYMIIIDRKRLNYELWIFAILFFVVDLIHFQYISSHEEILPVDFIRADFLHRLFYYTIPLATLLLFVWKIIQYKVMDYFTYVFAGLAILIALVFFENIDVSNKFILTLNVCSYNFILKTVKLGIRLVYFTDLFPERLYQSLFLQAVS